MKDGGSIIRSVVYSTICPTVLQIYTLTGNSGKKRPGEKKAFERYKNIFDVFFDVIHAYDKEYTKTDCRKDIRDRIFKFVKKEADKV